MVSTKDQYHGTKITIALRSQMVKLCDGNGKVYYRKNTENIGDLIKFLHIVSIESTVLITLKRRTTLENVVSIKGPVKCVGDMSKLFHKSKFDMDINHWDMSEVTSMEEMFSETQFNHPIGEWNVSNVKCMAKMFNKSKFNQPICNWDTSNVNDMHSMFANSKFNRYIGMWDVSSVVYMGYMFNNSNFDRCIRNWNTKSVTDMKYMFSNSIFNQPLNIWDTSSVVNMSNTFSDSLYNHRLNKWFTSNVRNMQGMFDGSEFDHPIDSWDTSNVINMEYMFNYSKYNHPLTSWDTSNVTNMQFMFSDSTFNHSIYNWDVSNVENMQYMFAYAKFNYPINTWDTTGVKNMNYMFRGSKYDKPLDKLHIPQNVKSFRDPKHIEEYTEDTESLVEYLDDLDLGNYVNKNDLPSSKYNNFGICVLETIPEDNLPKSEFKRNRDQSTMVIPYFPNPLKRKKEPDTPKNVDFDSDYEDIVGIMKRQCTLYTMNVNDEPIFGYNPFRAEEQYLKHEITNLSISVVNV